MADLAAKWGGTVEIDWADDLGWAHPLSDVSERVARLRFRWGGAERSNPQRPIVDFGVGRLVLAGDEFIPGRVEGLSAGVLHRRHRCRITPPDQAAIHCWARFDARTADTGRTAGFALEGLEVEDLAEIIDITQPTEGLRSDQAQWHDWVAQHLSLDIPLTVRAPVRAYDAFSFRGRRGEFISQVAQTLTALPVAGRAGSLRMHDPTMPTGSPPVIDAAGVAVLDAVPRLDTAHIRNRITETVTAPVMQAVTDRTDEEVMHAPDPPAALPVSWTGTVQLVGAGAISDVAVTLDRLEVRVATRFFGRRASGGWQFRVVEFGWAGVAAGSSRATVVESDGTATVTVTPQTGALTTGTFSQTWTATGQVEVLTIGAWSRVAPASAERLLSGTLTALTARRTAVYGARATVTVRWRTTEPQSGGDTLITVDDPASIAAWGVRPLVFPDWLLFTSEEQARSATLPVVARLGRPRRLHRVTVALPQPTPEGAAVVAAEPGDYRRVRLADRARRVDIDATCMVLGCEVRVVRGQRGEMDLLLVESGGRAYSSAYSAGYA